MCELHQLLQIWTEKTTAHRREVESLIGEIQFVANCVRQGRVFIARLLNWLRGTPVRGYQSVPLEARKDIYWWYVYLPSFNGIALMWYLNMEELDSCLATDASLNACGGFSEDEYFRHRFPQKIKNSPIKG